MRLHRAWMIVLAALLLAGCGQRIRADVVAVVEEHYSPAGQTYALLLMSDMPEDDARYLPELRRRLDPALEAAGYAASSPPDAADVFVFIGWGASGPHYAYRRAYPVRHPYAPFRYRGFYGRRSVIVAEEFYERIFRIDAVRNRLRATDVDGGSSVPAPLRSLPPDRSQEQPKVLWSVTVSSTGTLSRAQRLLPELAAAAAPWLGKAAQVRVQVSGDDEVSVLP